MSRLALVACACACACGPRAGPNGPPSGARSPRAGIQDITLYRDRAIVRQRVDVDVSVGASVVRAQVAAGAQGIVVADRGGLAIGAVHVRDADAKRDDDADVSVEVALDVVAPRAARYSIELAYATDRLRWDAAYTLTTTPARDRALLRGAVAIRNATAIAFRGAAMRVIDAELGAWGGKTGEQLASALVGLAASSTGPAIARELGRADDGAGETRIELLAGAAPRPMRAVLVYDPIGTRLDRLNSAPDTDADLGVTPAPSTKLVESFAIERDDRLGAGLPAGTVRLFERRADGTLAVLGASRIFEPGTRDAATDTIAVGIADGVTAHRERRELTLVDKRLVEEFAIMIDNDRATPIDVVVREHLYRGQTWALGYYSAPATKEGSQAFAMTARVAARAKTELFYVVVYCASGDDCEADGTHRPVR